MNYKDRKKQMEQMRFEKLMTLQEIGEAFGVSRQYVGQVIGTTGCGFTTQRLARRLLGKEHKTHKQLIDEVGVGYNTVSKYRIGENFKVHGAADEPTVVGAHFQDLCVVKLKELGFELDHRTGRHNRVGYHIELDNGKRIAVRGASKTSKAPSLRDRLRSPAWNFGIGRETEIECDYFILITVNEDYFVIPSEELRDKQEVRFCWPTLRPTMSKFGKYHDAFHLLR